MHHKICFFISFSESSPSFITSASTSPSTTPIGSVNSIVVGSSIASLTKPVPRPLGSSPLFSGPNSPLQSLLYPHPHLSGKGPFTYYVITFLVIFDTPLPHIINHHHFDNTYPPHINNHIHFKLNPNPLYLLAFEAF